MPVNMGPGNVGGATGGGHTNWGFSVDSDTNDMRIRPQSAGQHRTQGATPAGAPRAAGAPAPAASAAAASAASTAHEIVDIDSDPGQLDTPAKLRCYQLAQQAARKQQTSDAKLMMLHDAMSGLGREKNADLHAHVDTILSRLPDDEPLKAKLQAARDQLADQMPKLQKSMDGFLDLRQKQKEGEKPIVGSFFVDPKSALFGKGMGSTMLRAGIQTAFVVAGSAALQAATVELLRGMLKADPGLLPKNLLDKVNAAKSEDVSTMLPPDELVKIENAVSNLPPDQLIALATTTDKQIEGADLQQVIGDFVKPGSTYIDEANATTGEIYGAEAGIGGARGIFLAAADNHFESTARDQKLKDSLNPTPPTAGRKIMTAGLSSLRSQGLGGAISLAIGSLATIPGQVGRGMSAGKIGVEFGKNTTSAVLSMASNVAIDAGRSAPVFDKLTENQKQAVKLGARVASRIALQYVKTAVSLASSGKTLASLGGAGLVHAQNMMTGGVSGLLKEALGVASQVVTSKHLPSDEKYAQAVSGTVKKAVALNKVLSEPALGEALRSGQAGSSADGDASLVAARRHLQSALGEVHTAANLKANSPGVQKHWDAFDEAVRKHGELTEVVSTDSSDYGFELKEVVVEQPRSSQARPSRDPVPETAV